MTPPESKLRIVSLGGVDEIGKNMYVFEYEDDIVVVDCGSIFPKEDMLGVDLVIPDVTYLDKNRQKLRGYFIKLCRRFRNWLLFGNSPFGYHRIHCWHSICFWSWRGWCFWCASCYWYRLRNRYGGSYWSLSCWHFWHSWRG